MRLRNFDNITKVVREHGDSKAKEELEWLLKLARTNFAVCYGTGTQGPDAHDAATHALDLRLPLTDRRVQFIEHICNWLYAQAREKCTCQAPRFITGCDNAVATRKDDVDECMCTTGECPWICHTGVFL